MHYPYFHALPSDSEETRETKGLMDRNVNFMRHFFDVVEVREETDEHRTRDVLVRSHKNKDVNMSVLFGGSLDPNTRMKPLELSIYLECVMKKANGAFERVMLLRQHAFPTDKQDIVFGYEEKLITEKGDFRGYYEQHIDVSEGEVRNVSLDQFQIHDPKNYPLVTFDTADTKLQQFQRLLLQALPSKEGSDELDVTRVSYILDEGKDLMGEFTPLKNKQIRKIR